MHRHRRCSTQQVYRRTSLPALKENSARTWDSMLSHSVSLFSIQDLDSMPCRMKQALQVLRPGASSINEDIKKNEALVRENGGLRALFKRMVLSEGSVSLEKRRWNSVLNSTIQALNVLAGLGYQRWAKLAESWRREMQLLESEGKGWLFWEERWSRGGWYSVFGDIFLSAVLRLFLYYESCKVVGWTVVGWTVREWTVREWMPRSEAACSLISPKFQNPHSRWPTFQESFLSWSKILLSAAISLEIAKIFVQAP